MTTDNQPPAIPEDELRGQLRQVCHDLSNPIGVLRMAVYFLQSSKGDEEKRTRYLTIMNESLDKMDFHLRRMRALALGEEMPSE
jgi:signal transduction histidine kinase